MEIGNFGQKPKGTERQPKDLKKAKRGFLALLAKKGLKMLPKYCQKGPKEGYFCRNSRFLIVFRPKCQILPKHFGSYQNRNFRPKAKIFVFRLNSKEKTSIPRHLSGHWRNYSTYPASRLTECSFHEPELGLEPEEDAGGRQNEQERARD